jgi:hypothetical protein
MSKGVLAGGHGAGRDPVAPDCGPGRGERREVRLEVLLHPGRTAESIVRMTRAPSLVTIRDSSVTGATLTPSGGRHLDPAGRCLAAEQLMVQSRATGVPVERSVMSSVGQGDGGRVPALLRG